MVSVSVVLDMENKDNSWSDVRITINGREIKGIQSIEYLPTLEELRTDLKEAEQNEDYELCAKLRNSINNKFYK